MHYTKAVKYGVSCLCFEGNFALLIVYVFWESQSLWSVLREWDGISNLGVPRLKSVRVGPRSIVQIVVCWELLNEDYTSGFPSWLGSPRVGVLSPNWVNKLSVHFTFLFVSVYLFVLASCSKLLIQHLIVCHWCWNIT